MSDSIISTSIKNLYHIRNHDLSNLIEDLEDGTRVTAGELKNNFSWEVDEVFGQYGIDTLFDLSVFLKKGGSLKQLEKVTKGSTSQYEANYKLNQHFLETFEPDEDSGLLDVEASSRIEDFDEPTLFVKSTAEAIKVSTVLDIMNPYVFSPLKVEAFANRVWGVRPEDELTDGYSDSVLAALMEHVPGQNTAGIVTIVEPNGTFTGDAFFEIGLVRDAISYSNSVIPAILQSSAVLKDYIVIVQVFNDEEDVEVISPGGGVETVPRKYVAAWVCDEGLHYHGLDAEDVSTLYSTDFETQELLVPEEGVDFLDVPCIEFE